MNSAKQIKIGAIISYIGIVFNICMGLIYTPWMIGVLGQSDFGLYTLAMTFISYILFDFGLGNSIARFISKYRAEKSEKKIEDFLGNVYKIYAFLSIIILFILFALWFFIGGIYTGLTDSELSRFRVVYVIVGLASVVTFPFNTLDGILIAFEKFVVLKTCSVIQKVLVIACAVPALLLGYGLYAIILINAISRIVVILIKISIIKGRINLRINWKAFDKGMLKGILTFSIWISVIGLAEQLIMNIHPSLLAMLSTTAAISIFGIAKSIHSYAWSFADALNGLFLPRVARMDTTSTGKKDIDNLMIKVGRIQLIILGAIISGFAVFGKEFIGLWVGKEFNQAYYVALLMICPCSITLTQEIAKSKLYIVNDVKYRAIIYSATAVLCVALSCILIPKYGAMGSAISILVCFILGFIIALNIVYKTVLDIDVIRFFKECHLKLLPSFAVVLLLGFVISQIIPESGWAILVLKCLAFAVVYLIVMWLIGMNKSEKSLFTSLFRLTKK